MWNLVLISTILQVKKTSINYKEAKKMDRIKGEYPYDFKEKWDGNDYCGCMKPSCAPCKKLHPCPKPSLLVCGQGLPCELECGRGYKNDKEECAFVEIDTTCLCNPVVKVDFSANIFAEVKSKYYNKAKLIFKLVKVCENRNNFV